MTNDAVGRYRRMRERKGELKWGEPQLSKLAFQIITRVGVEEGWVLSMDYCITHHAAYVDNPWHQHLLCPQRGPLPPPHTRLLPREPLS